ncbi:MAG: metallophosphoesterase [Nitrosopumilaceae archaeon]|nr:metallophosphoesterase [Nitrosopumilaceae archaeon]NIU00572.1 metallophosphoesterase [Nitrosopumilaceae archaeon]NIU86958.1 metallophosphoesterase [Nitrosopumilaceae archaeon]NIV66422.1 metallophosphoesterase [Nitrosopumilaceae archaeon]NIX61174.1 metallophosphoesterase [Nitrosopumilaceae archaeon]
MVKTRIVKSKPALIIEGKRKTLVVTDLHIGFESNLAVNKIFLGKNTTTTETIQEIKGIIKNEKPDTLVLLGDVKSSITSITKSEWNDVPTFFEKIKDEIDIILVPGNHDGNISRLAPDYVSLVSSTGTVMENILLTHGHTMPSEKFSHVDKIVMGHVHPVFFEEDSLLNGKRVWISLRTKKEYIFPSQSGMIEIDVIPSFNRYFYATHKNKYKKSISPIIERIKKNSQARIVTLDGDIIGDESVIDTII